MGGRIRPCGFGDIRKGRVELGNIQNGEYISGLAAWTALVLQRYSNVG